MATTKRICSICHKSKITYICEGCSQYFCLDDLPEHQKNLREQLELINNDHNVLRQNINEEKLDRMKHPLIKQINQWEIQSIDRILQTAQEFREKIFQYSEGFFLKLEKKLNDLAQRIGQIHQQDEIHEFDLNELKQTLQKLQEVHQTANLSIRQQSTSLVNGISFERGICTRVNCIQKIFLFFNHRL